MPTNTTHILSKKEIAERTMEFTLEKPAGFMFKAGQAIDLTIENPSENDDEGNSRTFSIVATPNENSLRIATRMRDTAFKRILKNSPTGFPLKMVGPTGMFTLPSDTSKPVVFLTGGIGITPFMSMVQFATEKQSPQRMVLFYSNRRPEDAAYLNELSGLVSNNPHFVFVPTMTQPEKSAREWKGEKGYVTEEMVQKYVSNVKNCIYFIAGPPAMVENMVAMLRHAEVNEDNIRTEEFLGY